jgi:phage terminase large subunit-like protein
MTYEQQLQQFAGTSRTAIWFDEEPPKEIWTECLARLVDQGGSWWITMTPVDGMTWVYDDLYSRAALDDSIMVIEVDMLDNPHIIEESAEDYLGGLSKEERQIREHGRFISKTGLVYAPHLRAIHVLPEIEPVGSFLQFESMDHGFTNPTAWLWMQVNKDGDLFVYDEYYESERVVAENALAVIQQRSTHGLGPLYVVGDPAIEQKSPISGESIQIEYVRNGIPIIPANNDVKTGINRVISLLRGSKIDGEYYKRPKLFISESKCPFLLWEMRKLQYAAWHLKKMRAERNRKEEILKKDDHLSDALRYGVLSRPERDDGVWYPEPDDQYDSEGFRLDYSVGTWDTRLAPVPGIPKNDKISDMSLGDEF